MYDSLKTETRGDGVPGFHIKWKWERDGNERPSCRVFCMKLDPMPEGMILRQEDMIGYINKNIVDTSSPTDRVSNIEEYYKASRGRGGDCLLMEYPMGSEITQHVYLDLGNTGGDGLYFVCVYDEERFDARVLPAVSGEDEVRYEVKKTGALRGLIRGWRGLGTLTLELGDTGTRRVMTVTKQGGREIYSIVPAGEKTYYLPAEVKAGDIIGVRYMSSLIGS